MAARTGTQLKSDASAADTALATAVATPTIANVNAAITAFQTVVTNGSASERARSAVRPDGVSIGSDLAAQAGQVVNDLQLILSVAKAPTPTDIGALDVAAAKRMLLRIQMGLVLPGGWQSIKALPTTS